MSVVALEEAVLAGRRLVVCVGPGGVGKTSLSAALALQAAERERVALLTIDPARRLAGALGLDGLGDQLRPVPGAPQLSAAMLDTKASFDALVARIAEPAHLDRISQNAVYDAFSRTLARSHAYVAMERLHDLWTDDRFDRVIVDTPPTRSALDILDAPERLGAFVEDETVAAFVRPGLVGRGLRHGTDVALRLLSHLAGARLVEEMRGFFELFLPMREGFAERAATIRRALQARSTAFVLVTAPDAAHVHDAHYLASGLSERGLPPAAVLANRAFVPSPSGAPIREEMTAAERQRLLDRLFPTAGHGRDAASEALDRIARLRNHAAATTCRYDQALTAFSSKDAPVFRLPWLEEEPCDVTALRALIAAAVEAHA